MRKNPDQEKFLQLKRLERIVEKIDRDVDIAVVEGYMDKKALKELGFSGRIFLSAERTIEDLVEDVERAAQTVVILTDFDTHGKEQNREISHELQASVHVDFTAREEFGKELTSQGRHDIEDVSPLFSSWQDKYVDAALDRLFF